MTPSLKGIRASKAIRAFERAGGTRRRGKGDHVNIKMPNGRIVTLPSKGELKVGLLKDALRESGLSEAQFLDLLK
jgi:predicted RNA binding protein YcfA (HicA-like mRNA interferase family)